MMHFPFGEPVIFLAPGSRPDPYSGKPIFDDWSNPTTELIVNQCGIEPRSSSEDRTVTEQATITGFTVYLPGIREIDPGWRAEVRGDQWQVDGEVAHWRSPFTGWEPGTVVNLTRIE